MFNYKKLILLISFFGLLIGQDSPFVGTWKLAPSAGAMKLKGEHLISSQELHLQSHFCDFF